MKFYIVIPANNEANHIAKTLQSLVQQTYSASRIVVVDDESSDETANIILDFCRKYSYIDLIQINSSGVHLPGSKVINAFYEGFNNLDQDFDVICKFDADLIFPENYLEKLKETFQSDEKIGLAGGYCSIEKNEKWIPEKLASKDHLRGALKAYRKQCFEEIGGLKHAMGWDTADELLATFYGWKIQTLTQLMVKHLKPTAVNYSKASKYKQGESFYRLRYGFLISAIASGKLAFLKKDPGLFLNYIQGFYLAKKENRPYLLTEEEGRFVRKLRWENIRKKLF